MASRIDGRNELSSATCRLDLVLHHVAVFLLVLVEAGLVDALAILAQGPHPYLSVRATVLLGDSLHLLRK